MLVGHGDTLRVTDAGDTKFLPGEVVDRGEVDYENDRVHKERKGKGKHATHEQLLLGITRVALATDSWLSGASFQETIRVLVDAAAGPRGVQQPSATLAEMVQAECVASGLIVELGGRYGNVVRFLPPLTIDAAEIATVLEIFSGTVNTVQRALYTERLTPTRSAG